jgi:formate dehydrogenase maturation protein FdhE
MAERLTVSLEDGSVERLRALAGGERKVGAYLSQVTAWLWANRDELQDTPLEDIRFIADADYNELKNRVETVIERDDAALKQMQERMNELVKSIDKSLKEVIARFEEASPQELAEIAPEALPVLQRALSYGDSLHDTQQDSSQHECQE